MRTHKRGPDAKTPYIAYARLRLNRRTYSVQCSDKIHFPQLRIKCGVAKSCPGTHTALQAPMEQTTTFVEYCASFLIASMLVTLIV